jgi:osmoprotectant transport system ATP-binding protein
VITLEGVRKVYDDGSVAVDGLDLEAPTGKLTVFVGPSGCGKTTTLRMINRLIQPTDGEIYLDRIPTSQINVNELRRRIGYVIQHAGLFPHRTVLDNIATTARLAGSTKKAARERAEELLQRVGLPLEYGGRFPWQLSGGQQQRIGVARALAADPAYILMDEPFSAVDPIVRRQLQDEFLRIQRELGKTIIMVTHDIDEAIRMGDQIAIFRDHGVLEQFASPMELLRTPRTAFVSEFIGDERGYQSLGFGRVDLADLPVRFSVVHLGETAAAGDGWQVVLDAQDRPVGWTREGIPTTVTAASLNRGGTQTGPDATLRELLNGALSAPSQRALVVDQDGRYCGEIPLDTITGLIGHEPTAVGAEV